MTDFPSPKFTIGDVVFRGTVGDDVRVLPCPDCLGTQKWRVVTPAGSELTCECQRCGSYGTLQTPSGQAVPGLRMHDWRPFVTRLTIGSIRIDTAHPDAVEYMAVETGVGSGSIYRERDLFLTESEARADAEARCVANRAKAQATPEALEKFHFQYLTVEPAMQLADWNALYRAFDYARWHGETIDAVLDTDPNFLLKTRAEIVDYLEQRRDELARYEFIIPHPLEALVVAARASGDPAVRAAVAAVDEKYAARPRTTQVDA